ncbi:MAG: recombination-associated protein RdgC [Steroidobacteraceae bacterium]
MWFKNLTVYRLPADWSWSAASIEEALARRPLQPCSPLEMRSMGWVSPATSERLLHTLGGHHLVALGVDQKLLPASIVRQEAERRARAQAQMQGFPVGRRQMRALKMQVLEELRARALTRRRVTRAWIDPSGGWLVVDSASDRRAEELVETLRDTLGSLAVQKVGTERSPSACMAAWLMQADASGAFSIEQDLELQSAEPAKSIVRYRRHPLDGKEVRAYVAGGKRPTQLGLTWNGRISFVLTEKLQVKRVEFLEVAPESADEEEIDAAEQFDLDFAVMAGELAKLLIELIRELDGQQASGRPAEAAAA